MLTRWRERLGYTQEMVEVYRQNSGIEMTVSYTTSNIIAIPIFSAMILQDCNLTKCLPQKQINNY